MLREQTYQKIKSEVMKAVISGEQKSVLKRRHWTAALPHIPKVLPDFLSHMQILLGMPSALEIRLQKVSNHMKQHGGSGQYDLF